MTMIAVGLGALIGRVIAEPGGLLRRHGELHESVVKNDLRALSTRLPSLRSGAQCGKAVRSMTVLQIRHRRVSVGTP